MCEKENNNNLSISSAEDANHIQKGIMERIISALWVN